MTKYFVDTCVWIDFFESRIGFAGRQLGKSASKFFIKVFKNKDRILFSKEIYSELRKKYSVEEIDQRLRILLINSILTNIVTTKNEISEALEISEQRSIPLNDCLIAIQARNHAAIIVTQDMHFFSSLNDIAESVRPSEEG